MFSCNYLYKIIAIFVMLLMFGCSTIKTHDAPIERTAIAKDTHADIVEIQLEGETLGASIAPSSAPSAPAPLEIKKQLDVIRTVKRTKTTKTTTSKRGKVIVEEIKEVIEIDAPQLISSPQPAKMSEYITQVLTWVGMLSTISVAWYTAVKSKEHPRC